MIAIICSNSHRPDFIELVKLLDADLAERDGQDHKFYATYYKIDEIKCVILAYARGTTDRLRGVEAIRCKNGGSQAHVCFSSTQKKRYRFKNSR